MKNDLIYENEAQQDNAGYDPINEVKGELRDNQYVAENLNGTLWVNGKMQQVKVRYITRQFSQRNWVAVCSGYDITKGTPEAMVKELKRIGYTFKGWA
jgi:hypothetical protein